MTGTIPTLEAMIQLEILDLGANYLTGRIPPVGSSLTTLILSANALTGSLWNVSTSQFDKGDKRKSF